MKRPDDFRQLIELWQPNTSLAVALEVSKSTVENWKYENLIPAARWLQLAELAAQRGVRLELRDFARMQAAARRRDGGR